MAASGRRRASRRRAGAACRHPRGASRGVAARRCGARRSGIDHAAIGGALMKVDDNGWLVSEHADPPVHRLPTVRTYSLAVDAPLGLVWHTTDERGGPGYAEALARR